MPGTRRRSRATAEASLALVLPLETLDVSSLAQGGGKAANLGEMLRAGLPVPPGFCVTTAAYSLATERTGLEPILAELEAVGPDDSARLAELVAAARAVVLEAPMPAEVAEAVQRAYGELGHDRPAPVAVRSSATAEDLPFASFAGQQDTFLNVIGMEALLDAVRRCWASLWTERATSYRASNGIDQRSVRLAVVVQQMVDAAVAGVLFTANPLTGKRRQAVIDASPGLGEAVVSGAVNPDHFVVDTASGIVLERSRGGAPGEGQRGSGGAGEVGAAPRGRPGAGEDGREDTETGGRGEEHPLPLGEGGGEGEQSAPLCLSDAQLQELAALGARVEAHYGAPQDLEFAIDGNGTLWLTQARPITTLYPLPAKAPQDERELRVYFSVNVAQGVFRPFTPMGVQVFRVIASSMAELFGTPPGDRLDGPPHLVEAGQRLFFDVTGVLRNEIGRWVFERATAIAEARSSAMARELRRDPRLSVRRGSGWGTLRGFIAFLRRTELPLRAARSLREPRAARARAASLEREIAALAAVMPDAGAAERLLAAERVLWGVAPLVVLRLAPIFVPGLACYALAGRLLGDLATQEELQTVLRGLPHNPTIEMDLALWALAERARAEAEARRALSEKPPEALSLAYRQSALPVVLQTELEAFLQRYGHRGVAEIDLGLPRWSEDPSYILGILRNYLQVDDPALHADAQFRRAEQEAEAMVAELSRRAADRGGLRGRLVGFLLGRARALAGLREAPKFYFVRGFAHARALLLQVGGALARAERLQMPEDIFFLDLREVRAALAGVDQRGLVRERKAAYEYELRRRRVPRMLLSDGTEPTLPTAPETADGVLRGTPASSGVVSGTARVILEPHGARLEPGEILVAPSTDPGWTPLFLSAGGLVMEMGGMMSHGAVVAREYGIPAVVGLVGATEVIRTGQWITVDGGAGSVVQEVQPALT